MKRTNLNLAKRPYTLWVLLATLLIMPSVALVTSAEVPQGKGGEVVAKPTATKSRATSKSTSRPAGKAISLEGTVWDVKYRVDGKEYSYEFLADGKITINGAAFGEAWKQKGTRIVITYSDPNVTFVQTGIISGNRMNGTGRSKDENGKIRTFKWSAKLNTEND